MTKYEKITTAVSTISLISTIVVSVAFFIFVQMQTETFKKQAGINKALFNNTKEQIRFDQEIVKRLGGTMTKDEVPAKTL